MGVPETVGLAGARTLEEEINRIDRRVRIRIKNLRFEISNFLSCPSCPSLFESAADAKG
jgi:hypothetical protein